MTIGGGQVSLQLGLCMCSKCSLIYHTFVLEILFPVFHLWFWLEVNKTRHSPYRLWYPTIVSCHSTCMHHFSHPSLCMRNAPSLLLSMSGYCAWQMYNMTSAELYISWNFYKSFIGAFIVNHSLTPTPPPTHTHTCLVQHKKRQEPLHLMLHVVSVSSYIFTSKKWFLGEKTALGLDGPGGLTDGPTQSMS